MAEAQVTCKMLADALKTLMVDVPLQRITVGDICGKCGMNRKSFYYHFRDKFDLVGWIFRSEFYEGYLFAHGAESEDTLLQLCRFLAQEKQFYRAALKVDGQNSFREELGEALRPIVQERMASPGMNGEEMSFYLRMVVGLYQEEIARWVLGGCAISADHFVQLMYQAYIHLKAVAMS